MVVHHALVGIVFPFLTCFTLSRYFTTVQIPTSFRDRQFQRSSRHLVGI